MPLKIAISKNEWLGALKASEKRSGSRNQDLNMEKQPWPLPFDTHNGEQGSGWDGGGWRQAQTYPQIPYLPCLKPASALTTH